MARRGGSAGGHAAAVELQAPEKHRDGGGGGWSARRTESRQAGCRCVGDELVGRTAGCGAEELRRHSYCVC